MFDDKIVWITGASSGIGEALVYEFDKLGSKIIISARKEKELQRVKQNCTNEENIYIEVLDLEESGNFPMLTKKLIDHFGRIDYLFNNGGISQRGDVSDTLLEVDRRLMEINYFGNIALTKAVLPYMINDKFGHFIITSSLSGKFGFFKRSAYSASKHALHGFYESLRLENLDNGIKVTMVCPGYINTSISQNALTGQGDKHGAYDENQQKGMSAQDCAKKIVSAVRKGKEEVIFGGKEVLAAQIKRFFPGIFTSIMKKQKPID